MAGVQAGWFAGPERRLFGYVHVPRGDSARAAVVICPSMGQESVFAYSTMRQLAESLAAAGFLVVRFDYDGTGDSEGNPDDPGRVEAWISTVVAAAALARGCTAAPLVLLGMRLGALLALAAAERIEDVHGLALWDCPRSGTSFLREMRVRQNVAMDSTSTSIGGFTGLGMHVPAHATDDLAALNPRAMDSLPCDAALLVDRPGRSAFRAGVETRTSEPPARVEDPQQDELMMLQSLPDVAPAAIVSWCRERYVDAKQVAPPGRELLDPELRTPSGLERVTSLGPHGLFAIETVPTRLRTSTAVVFVPDYFTPHVGLFQIWTELARHWAEAGIRSVRFDLSGCAESPPRPGRPGHEAAIVEHIDDVLDTVHATSPDDPGDVALVGLCLGGYLSLEVAARQRVRAVAVINPPPSLLPQEAPPHPSRRALRLTRPWVDALLGRPAGRLAERLVREGRLTAPRQDPNFRWDRMVEGAYWQGPLYRAAPDAPDWVWTLINRVALRRRTEDVLGDIVRRGSRLLVIVGRQDWPKITHGSHRAIDALTASGQLRLEYLADIDHSIMRPPDKELVSGRLKLFLAEVLGGSEPVPGR